MQNTSKNGTLRNTVVGVLLASILGVLITAIGFLLRETRDNTLDINSLKTRLEMMERK